MAFLDAVGVGVGRGGGLLSGEKNVRASGPKVARARTPRASFGADVSDLTMGAPAGLTDLRGKRILFA